MLSESLEKQRRKFFDDLYDNLSPEEKMKIDFKIATKYAELHNITVREAMKIIQKSI